MSLVYKATAPSGRSYIGVTSESLKRRRWGHEHDARKGSHLPFHKALRKYGDAIRWEVLVDGVSFAEANRLEIEAIVAHGTRTPKGYNVSVGGGGNRGHVRSRAAIEATAAKMRGRTRSPESVARSAAGLRGHKHTPEARKNMSLAHLGQTPPRRALERALEANTKMHPQHRENVRMLRRFGATQQQCAEWFGVSRTCIKKITREKPLTLCAPEE